MTERKSRDERFMALCRDAVDWGTCPRLRVGAVVARGGEIVKPGWNGAPAGQPHCDDIGCIMDNGHCVRALHAEDNALHYAGREACQGATLYVSHFPCWRCANLIVRAGIARVVFEDEYGMDERTRKLLMSVCCLDRFVDGKAVMVRVQDIVK